MAHSAKLIERLGQVALGTDPWPGDVRLSDIEPLFVCQACGRRGADVRPDFDGDRKVVGARFMRWLMPTACRSGSR